VVVVIKSRMKEIKIMQKEIKELIQDVVSDKYIGAITYFESFLELREKIAEIRGYNKCREEVLKELDSIIQRIENDYENGISLNLKGVKCWIEDLKKKLENGEGK